MESLRADTNHIIKSAIRKVLPHRALSEALDREMKAGAFDGKIVRVLAIGKAAWTMAQAAAEKLKDRIETGIVITKHGHVEGEIDGFRCFEAGHPISDAGTYQASAEALQMVREMGEGEILLFLVSGGGSALFEYPLIEADELADINRQLLASGADIVEINTIRKRLSSVKGGRLAQIASPAEVYSIILSDVLGDPLDMIASGPAYPDSSTVADAQAVAHKYDLKLSDQARECLGKETPKKLDNVRSEIIGSVSRLCEAAAEACRELGYEPHILTDRLDCEARDAGAFLASVAAYHAGKAKSDLAFIAGGETVVHVRGKGKGGRNQELALAAARGIAGLEGVSICSIGSDGTDGPTDAAGGVVDGHSLKALGEAGIDLYQCLQENDAYHALRKIGGLIVTGASGTNVNDVSFVLIRRACV